MEWFVTRWHSGASTAPLKTSFTPALRAPAEEPGVRSESALLRRSDSSATRSRIYIVDDHRLFISGLSSLINHEADLEVCGSSENEEKMLLELSDTRPDLVVIDVKLREGDGLSVAQALRKANKKLPFLFISSLADDMTRQRATQLGARGFLEKTQEPERILEGIRRALAL